MPRRLAFELYQWMWAAIDLLYPQQCPGCEQAAGPWCSDCQNQMHMITGPVCELCGFLLSSAGEICPDCAAFPPVVDGARSLAVFEGSYRKAIHRLKYRGNASLGEALAFPLMSLIITQHWPFDLVAPVPLGKKREKERGYNQAALVSRPVALYFGKPHRPRAIWRIRETASQVHLSAQGRRHNVVDAFAADPHLVSGKDVLVIDDVMTTGSTMNAVAAALKNAGAARVYALSLARALPHTDHPESGEAVPISTIL